MLRPDLSLRSRRALLNAGAVALSLLAACATATDSSTEKESAPALANAASPTGGGSRATPAADAAVAPMVPEATHQETKLGVPTFVWMRNSSATPFARTPDMKAEDVAWAAVARAGDTLNLGRKALDAAYVTEVDDSGKGVVVTRFAQRHEGLDVFRVTLNVAMTRDLQPVAITGYLAPVVKARKGHETFDLDARAGISAALKAMKGVELAPAELTHAGEGAGGYDLYRFGLASGARVKKVWFPQRKGLDAAYYVELDVERGLETTTDMHAFVVSATDGAPLFHKDLTAFEAFNYRVWAETSGEFRPYEGPTGTAGTPHPTGTPDRFDTPFIPASLVALDHAPFSKNDPWLPTGATTTKGNNVDAYSDITFPDGYNAISALADGGAPDGGIPDGSVIDSGIAGVAADTRPGITSANTFDFPYDHARDPKATLAQTHAATTQLFYDLNFLHDWFYDSGFDEKAGNHQKDNLGRGGVGNDTLLGEAQDYSGRDNANASTPADGKSARIQMYVFTGIGVNQLQVNAPGSVAGDAGEVQGASFGPDAFNVTGSMVVADDGTGTATDACEPLVNAAAAAGKVVLADRGTCNFTVKVKNAQNAGAIGVLIGNNVATGLPSMGGADPTVTIPSLGIAQAKATQLKAAAGVNVTLKRTAAIADRDGSLDNLVIAHEWGHTLSNRLIGNASGIDNQQGGGMGEGWSDFVALMLQARAEDAQVAANANWNGVYADAIYDETTSGNNGFYFGFRRFPYSADMTKNPLTFKHVSDGVPLPTTAPINPTGGGGTNSEVHNVGEIWATMLWECYTSLLRDAGRLTFNEARDRMKRYLVASLKLTPNTPTILEARDALLAAAFASDRTDYESFSTAFAKRGAGVGAVAPAREARDNAGAVESFTTGNDFIYVDSTLTDDVKSCDHDGVLDSKETGSFTVSIKNIGLRDLRTTTAVVSTHTPGITFANGGNVTFPASQPFQTVSTSVEVSMAGETAITPFTIDIEMRDQGLAVFRTIYAKHEDAGHYDVVAANSKTESVDTPISAWAPAGDATLPVTDGWKREVSGANGYWHVRDNGGKSDQWLATPPLTVAASGALTVTFKNRWSFEADEDANYDGGVLEISEDNGAHWTDVGSHAAPTYGGDLFTDSDNPIGGRTAYVGTSDGYPNWITTTLNLGTTYASKTVLLRFRVATDLASGGPGWDLDDLVFSGITNTPFASRVSDRAQCTNRPPTANAGPGRSVAERSEVTLAGTATDSDGDKMTFAWTQKAGPAVKLDNAASLTPKFTAPDVKESTTLTFQLVANDGKEASAPSTVDITVEDTNRAPVANAGPPQNVSSGADVKLDGSGSKDADGDDLTYTWFQTSGTPVALKKADTDSPTFTAPFVEDGQVANLWFTLTVSDGKSTSMPSSVGVVVGAKKNNQPVPGGSDGGGCAVTALGVRSSSAPVGAAFGLGIVAAFVAARRRRTARRTS